MAQGKNKRNKKRRRQQQRNINQVQRKAPERTRLQRFLGRIPVLSAVVGLLGTAVGLAHPVLGLVISAGGVIASGWERGGK
jgi:hypothetical protein